MYMRSFPKTSYQFWSHFGLNALFCQSDLLLPGFSQTGLFNIQSRCKFIFFGNQLHRRRRRSPQGLFVLCKFLRCRPKLSNTSVLLGYFLYSSFKKILDCYSNRIWLQAGILEVHRKSHRRSHSAKTENIPQFKWVFLKSTHTGAWTSFISDNLIEGCQIIAAKEQSPEC